MSEKETCLFEPGKEYVTLSGRRARIYAVDCSGPWVIHGAILTTEGWSALAWCRDGTRWADGVVSFDDLMPPTKPRVKETFWVNVYHSKRSVAIFYHRETADSYASPDRAACVRVDIDVENGHGLDGDPS